MKWLYAVVFYAATVAQIFIRLPFRRMYRRASWTRAPAAFAERFLLVFMAVEGLGLPALYGFTPWLRFADYPVGSAASIALAGCGVAVTAAGIWLFWRSHRDLDSNWSPSLELSTEQTLVTDGVYASMRHPMYAAQLVLTVGRSLLIQNWIAGPVGFVVTALLFFVRVPQEERMMADRFAGEYERYRARSGRFFPRVRG